MLLWAYRARPLFAAAVSKKDPIEEYRTVVMSRPRLFGIGIPLLFALPFGLSAQSRWETVQLFLNGGSFGTVDAEFGHDIGFYVFDLPFYRLVLTWLLVAVFLPSSSAWERTTCSAGSGCHRRMRPRGVRPR